MPNLPQRHGARAPIVVRGTTAQRGYDNCWRKCRDAFLAADPLHRLCTICLRRGWTVATAEVDHIRPLSEGGARLDWSNLQGLCKACHARKTLHERRPAWQGTGRKGWGRAG